MDKVELRIYPTTCSAETQRPQRGIRPPLVVVEVFEEKARR